MNELVLTVVVPVFNVGSFLEKCLSSLIVAPCYHDLYEVLVVNDGSTDGSLTIAECFAERYPKLFHIVDKNNAGHGSCCNLGVSMARGKYIHFLDSDDWFDSSFENYLKRLSQEDADVVFTKCIHEYINDGKQSERFCRTIQYDSVYSLEELHSVSFTFSLHEVSYSVRNLREAKIHFREKARYDDTILSVAGFIGTRKLAFYSIPLYHYLLGRPGQTMDPAVWSRRFDERCQAVGDCFHLYSSSLSLFSKLQKNKALKALENNVDCLFAGAWHQDKDLAKQFLSRLSFFLEDNKRIHKEMRPHLLERIYRCLPFSVGFFIVNKML